MTYGGKQDGGAVFDLTPEEHERFKAGQPVVRVTGSAHGQAVIKIQMTLPVEPDKRFPPSIYPEDHPERLAYLREYAHTSEA